MDPQGGNTWGCEADIQDETCRKACSEDSELKDNEDPAKRERSTEFFFGIHSSQPAPFVI